MRGTDLRNLLTAALTSEGMQSNSEWICNEDEAIINIAVPKKYSDPPVFILPNLSLDERGLKIPTSTDIQRHFEHILDVDSRIYYVNGIKLGAIDLRYHFHYCGQH